MTADLMNDLDTEPTLPWCAEANAPHHWIRHRWGRWSCRWCRKDRAGVMGWLTRRTT